MLKDVLFKREKDKIQNSRQSSLRGDQQSGRISEAKRATNTKYVNAGGPNDKENSDSKIRVQNFIQKLQIKV